MKIITDLSFLKKRKYSITKIVLHVKKVDINVFHNFSRILFTKSLFSLSLFIICFYVHISFHQIFALLNFMNLSELLSFFFHLFYFIVLWKTWISNIHIYNILHYNSIFYQLFLHQIKSNFLIFILYKLNIILFLFLLRKKNKFFFFWSNKYITLINILKWILKIFFTIKFLFYT